MQRVSLPVFRPQTNRHRLGSLFALAAVLLTATVAVADDYAYTASHRTKRAPDHVLEVLTAYGRVCDQGCQYHGPDVVKFIRVQELRSESKWYTWTHVKAGGRNVMHFNEVVLQGRSSEGFTFTTRLLEEQDKALVEKLSQRTGLQHNPAFDYGLTTIRVARQGDTTHVTQSMKMRATGLLTMFPGRIKAGMQAGAEATFRNIEK